MPVTCNPIEKGTLVPMLVEARGGIITFVHAFLNCDNSSSSYFCLALTGGKIVLFEKITHLHSLFCWSVTLVPKGFFLTKHDKYN